VPWTGSEDALLGTMKDKDVAAETRRTLAAVQGRRYELKVPPLTKRKPRGESPRWTWERDSLLGTMTDTDLARRLRCSPMSVFYRRKRLGIAAFSN